MPGKLGQVEFEITSEMGDRIAQVHANRLRKISNLAVKPDNQKRERFQIVCVCLKELEELIK